jgi:hypothetical protein
MRETLELAREAAGERTNAVASCVNNLAEVLRYQVGGWVGCGQAATFALGFVYLHRGPQQAALTPL